MTLQIENWFTSLFLLDHPNLLLSQLLSWNPFKKSVKTSSRNLKKVVNKSSSINLVISPQVVGKGVRQSILVLRFPGHFELYARVGIEPKVEHRQMGVQITPLETHAWMLCCSWKLPEATIWLCVTPPLRRMNELVPCSKLPEALSDSLSLTQKVGVLVKHACTSTTLHSFTRKLVSHCNYPQPDQKIKTQGHKRGNSIH